MSYLVGVIFLIFIGVILAYSVPTGMLVGAAVVIFFSALTIQISANLITHKKVPFSNALKALSLSIVFVFTAAFLAMKLVTTGSPALVFLAPMLMFLGQLLAFSFALDLTLVASALVAICASAVAWGASYVLGLSFLTAFRVLH